MDYKTKKPKFSLITYLAIVILLSWSFQIAHAFLGEESRSLLLVSMIMVAIGTFLCGKYIFKDTLDGCFF